MKRYSYHEQDYAFGQLMLTLRTTIGLTQAGLAEVLHVHRRAVAGWEAGWRYGFPQPKIWKDSHAAAESLLRSVVAPPTLKRFGAPICVGNGR